MVEHQLASVCTNKTHMHAVASYIGMSTKSTCGDMQHVQLHATVQWTFCQNLPHISTVTVTIIL